MTKAKRLRWLQGHEAKKAPAPVSPPEAPPEAADPWASYRTQYMENGVPLPPTPPPWVASGVLIEWHPERKGCAFNFWGMPIEDAITDVIDTLTRLNAIHNTVMGLGLPGMPMSLTELDEMVTAKIGILRAQEARANATEPGGPPAMSIVGGGGVNPAVAGDEVDEVAARRSLADQQAAAAIVKG